MKYFFNYCVLIPALTLCLTAPVSAAIKTATTAKPLLTQKQKISNIIAFNIFKLNKKLTIKIDKKPLAQDNTETPIQKPKPTVNTNLILSGITIIKNDPTAIFFDKDTRKYVPYKLNQEISIGKIKAIKITQVIFSANKKTTTLSIGQNLLAQDTRLPDSEPESSETSDSDSSNNNDNSRSTDNKTKSEFKKEFKKLKKLSALEIRMRNRNKRSRNR